MDCSNHNFHELSLDNPITPKTSFLLDAVVNFVFEDYVKKTTTHNVQKFPLPLSDVTLSQTWNNICRKLKSEASEKVSNDIWNEEGRIGPSDVGFHKECAGSFEYKDGLEISSKDNFSTVYSDTCVYAGKWQYEVLLGSKGVMQIGWATINCTFSQENGVGDTRSSYAYDGNRQRKWNSSTSKYGELWSIGDIISSTIDLEKGEIAYYRNGRSMGIAFKNIPTGPGIAYFPAFSLAMDESLVVNFGGTPFCYPIHDFHSLQAPPEPQLHVAKMCFKWLDKLVMLSTSWNKFSEFKKFDSFSKESRMTCLLLIAENIGSLLSSILVIPYVIEETLVRSLFEYIKTSTSQLQKQETLLQFLLAVLQEEEQNTFLNTLLICLQRIYRRTALSFDFENQKCVLKILHLIFSDAALRKFCLKNILFQKESCYRILSFVSINCIDKINFKNFVDLNYWSSRNGGFEIGCRQEYYCKVKEIGVTVQELRDLQVSLFSLLLTADDAESYKDSSRALFLLKFRNLIKNQVITSRPSFSPLISTCVFHSFFTICLFVFNRLWKIELEELPSEKTIKPSIFFDDVLEYFEIQRLGGLESHLKKQHASELKNTLDILKQNTQIFSSLKTKDDNCLNSVFNVRNSQPSSSRTVLGEILVSLNEGIQKINVQGLKPQPVRTKEELQTSLLHLFDGTVLLYHHSGHKYMEKVAAQTDAFFDNVKYYEDLQAKIKKYMEEDENYSSTVLHELRNSAIVMDSKLKDQCYHHAWNLATVLSLENTKKMLLFLKIVLGALQESSKIGCLFTFVPDFYIETLTQVSQDLNCLISCDQNSERNDFENFIFYQPGGFDIPKPISQEYFNLLKNVGEYLALHFSDPRIVYADSKDFLIQALAGFVCQRPGLEALESIPVKSREAMIISLLKPYENRAWAQNNWILVRFWKGKGFGFRFTKSPHLNNRLGPKPTHYEIPNVLSYAPYPSDVFLHHTSEALKQPEISTPFLNSLLNQLNWVFSEFIGMLQEIQNASNRPERVFIDSRQLRICATCFDLTLALLRVLEMAVSVAPNVFLDPNRQDSKPLLTRLIQVLCQVLNRVSFSSGCFSHVVNLEIPGLETIHYFPMLTAVIGIICSLLKEDIEHGKGKQAISPATKGFLDDPSFQMNSIYSFVGGKSALKPAALYVNSNDSNSLPISNLFTSPECDCKRQKFCLRRYPDSVSEQELRMVVNVINHLEKMSSLQQNANIEDNDSLCTICYASSVDAVFVPCGHTSCTSCISQYLMNQTDCFFCMKLIELVKDNTGKVIYTLSKLVNPP